MPLRCFLCKEFHRNWLYTEDHPFTFICAKCARPYCTNCTSYNLGYCHKCAHVDLNYSFEKFSIK